MADPGAYLLWLARTAIAKSLGVTPPATVAPPSGFDLTQPGATFVTLTHHGHLRGCIGSLEAHRPLIEDVQANALAAAFRDPRFVAVNATEWPEIRVEVSLLTPPEPFTVANEAALRRVLRPHIDGLIFAAGHRRATFLPQVWDQLPDVGDFLSHLRQKAGLPANYWGEDVRLARYQVRKWKET